MLVEKTLKPYFCQQNNISELLIWFEKFATTPEKQKGQKNSS
jgi:hypothetical protein